MPFITDIDRFTAASSTGQFLPQVTEKENSHKAHIPISVSFVLPFLELIWTFE